MSSANRTPNYNLPQWLMSEKPEMTDLNAAFLALDGARKAADLSSTAAGKGASLVGLQDAGGLLTATQVEAALQEIAQNVNLVRTGWTPANKVWTYLSPNTFTIVGDVTGEYYKGYKLKWTQTTVKYGHVYTAVYSAGTGLTTITILVNTDFVLTNAVISANYWSNIENPAGFPSHFNYAADLGPQAGTMVNVTVVSFYSVKGQRIICTSTVTVSDRGTCTGYMKIGTPTALLHSAAGSGQEVAQTGKALSVGGTPAIQYMLCGLYDYTTAWVNGYVVLAQMEYLF